MANYLTFSSAEPFTIATAKASKSWDGTLYYSTNAITWSEWDGTTAIASAEHEGEQRIHMRGIGNSVITGILTKRWVLTGNDVACTGNIENLLDYEIVKSGEHPVMATNCYYGLFSGWSGLTTAPALPATTLANGCYGCMFEYCTSLTTLPALPATTLADSCYQYMFSGCTSIKLSETQTDNYPYEYRIPISGTGTTATNALLVMFTGTGGALTGMPEINTTYYTSNRVIVDEIEPTLTECDFYRVINGSWVKCDAVRPMGGEWVKQDEYRYE